MEKHTTKYPKVVFSKSIIRFQDCDPFNHLNNAAYINYFMNHREDMLLQHYNLDIYTKAREEGKSWVSTSNQIAYLRPTLLMEKVVIRSQLFRFTKSELYVEMQMLNEDQSQLKSIIWCGFTHFNLLKQHREIHNSALIRLFDESHLPIECPSFEERVKQLKNIKM